MDTQQWLEVKLPAETIKKKEQIRGVDVFLYVSPYDVPEAIRGFYDNKKRKFLIQFKYIDDEPKEDRGFDTYVKLKIGKNSERLYAIEIDVDTLRANQVQLQMAVQREVDGAFSALLAGSPSRRLENYQLAKAALETRQRELFAAIA